MRYAAVLALAVCLLAAGCTGPGSKPATTTGLPAEAVGQGGDECLRGLITDEELLPIGGVFVGLRPPGLQTETRADGRFELCGVAAGRFQLDVARSGYLPWSRVIDLPLADGELAIILKPVPVLEPYVLVVPKVIHYTWGISALDTTASRHGVNLATCAPCTWSLQLDSLPDHMFWQAAWKRNPSPPSDDADKMFHILRGGAPFEAGSDIGAGTMARPWGFGYTRDDLAKNTDIKSSKEGVPLSGSNFCDGDPAWPCVDQRINAYLSFFYDYPTLPDGYTALPPT